MTCRQMNAETWREEGIACIGGGMEEYGGWVEEGGHGGMEEECY